MRQPEVTKERILKYSGRLFNTQGYKATSLSDITAATGLTKGAIYRHFKSKEALEGETLMHLSRIMLNNVGAVVKAEFTAPEKLRAIFHYFESYISYPPIIGGCPLQNVAIESDDNNPALRRKAVAIMDVLRDSVVRILENGIRHGQLKKGIDKQYYSAVIISSLEGGIMMSRLRRSTHDIKLVILHLEKLLDEIVI